MFAPERPGMCRAGLVGMDTALPCYPGTCISGFRKGKASASLSIKSSEDGERWGGVLEGQDADHHLPRGYITFCLLSSCETCFLATVNVLVPFCWLV